MVSTRSPSSSTDDSIKLFKHIKSCTSTDKFSHVLVSGDFNLKEISWETWNTQSTDKLGQELLEAVGDAGLHQKVNFNTRHRNNQTPSLLDLVLVNEDDMAQNLKSLPPLGKSDHIIIAFDFHCYYDPRSTRPARYQYHKGDYTSIKESLASIDWDTELQNKSVNDMWTTFKHRLESEVEANIPKSSTAMGRRSKPLWMSFKSSKEV